MPQHIQPIRMRGQCGQVCGVTRPGLAGPQVGQRRSRQRTELPQLRRLLNHVDDPESPAGGEHSADLGHDRIPIQVPERQKRDHYIDVVVRDIERRAVHLAEPQSGAVRAALPSASEHAGRDVHSDTEVDIAVFVQRAKQRAIAATNFENA
jgi:hypothetical protein